MNAQVRLWVSADPAHRSSCLGSSADCSPCGVVAVITAVQGSTSLIRSLVSLRACTVSLSLPLTAITHSKTTETRLNLPSLHWDQILTSTTNPILSGRSCLVDYFRYTQCFFIITEGFQSVTYMCGNIFLCKLVISTVCRDFSYCFIQFQQKFIFSKFIKGFFYFSLM